MNPIPVTPFRSPRRRALRVRWLAWILPAVLGLPASAAPDLVPIEMTCVDPAATGYGTFQSHNQKVVANGRGIFMTHVRTRNEAYTAQEWRLSWSHDGGRTFETLLQATHATNPPVLETDGDDNLYLVRPDFLDGNAYLYRFLAQRDYREPTVTCIPNGSAGKYSLILDRERRQLCYFAHNNTFHRIGLDGTVLSTTNILAAGKSAALQYPLLSLDAGGTLHAAWTTQRHGVYLYWDIHYLQSPDGGLAWRTMRGTPVALPVVADEGGPADRITLDDEFEAHTWLESFLVRGGKAHFLYLAQTQPPRQHYVRYDIASARREIDLQPEFRGQQLSLRNLDGFFATRAAEPGATIYVISRDASSSRLACLASDDNGASWYDYAVSEPVSNLYAIGGCREITRDGYVIGSFTEPAGPTTDAGGSTKVHFFKMRAREPAPPEAAVFKSKPDVVIHEGTYPGWPWVAKGKDGTLYCVFREGTEHDFSATGRALLCRSQDAGKSWSKAEVIVDQPGVDDRNVAVAALQSGDLLVVFNTYTTGRESLAMSVRSSDGGLSWSRPASIGEPNTRTRAAPVSLSGGAVLLAYYVAPGSGALAARSTDQGRTWTTARVPDAEGFVGDEWDALEVPPDRIIGILRNNHPGSDGYFWKTESRDGGKSWSVPRKTNVQSRRATSPPQICRQGKTPTIIYADRRMVSVSAVKSADPDFLRWDIEHALPCYRYEPDEKPIQDGSYPASVEIRPQERLIVDYEIRPDSKRIAGYFVDFPSGW